MHIYNCSAKFCGQNPVIYLEIHAIGNSAWKRSEKLLTQILLTFKLVKQIQQEAAWFKSDFGVICDLYLLYWE